MKKIFSGFLEQDSKKVHSELKQLFGVEILSEFEDLYKKRFYIYKVEETNLNRTVGANYNPKILRILLLQIRDAFVKHINTFKATIFLDIPEQLINDQVLSDEVSDILKTVKTELQNLSSKTINKEQESLIFSALLDEIRHYHQELDPNEQRILSIQNYLNSLGKITNETLHSKCLHALKLQGLRV